MVTERCQETEISGNKENLADRDIHVCFPRQNFITSDIAVLLFCDQETELPCYVSAKWFLLCMKSHN